MVPNSRQDLNRGVQHNLGETDLERDKTRLMIDYRCQMIKAPRFTVVSVGKDESIKNMTRISKSLASISVRK